MKKIFLFDGVFWGLLLVLIGLLLVLRNLFGVSIPSIWNVVWPIILIYIGVNIAFKRSDRLQASESGNVVFDQENIRYEEGKSEYNAIFGQGRFDLTNLKTPKSGSRKIKVNTIFAKGTVKIKKDLPLRIKATAVFGEARLPDKNTVAFGDSTYTSKTYKKDSPHIAMEANCVFGSLDIVEV